MRSAIDWQCPSCDTPIRAETGGHGCFPFPKITCPVCGSLQEKRLGVGLYTLSYYDKTRKVWTSFQYQGANDPSRNASES
jgi:hypothetical protein